MNTTEIAEYLVDAQSDFVTNTSIMATENPPELKTMLMVGQVSQNVALERIASALERIADELQDSRHVI